MTEEVTALRMEMAELRQRVARAERRSQRMAALGAAALVASLILAAPRPASTQGNGHLTRVRAPFAVVSRDGRTLFDIRESPESGVATLRDRRGKIVFRAEA